MVEVELFLSIGWSWLIREVGRFSRNRVVLGFDPKDGWLVVGAWLEKFSLAWWIMVEARKRALFSAPATDCRKGWVFAILHAH